MAKQNHRITRALVFVLSVMLVAIGQLATRPDWHAGFHASYSESQSCDQILGPGDASECPDQNESGCAIDLYSAGGLHVTEASAPILPQGINELNRLALSTEIPPIIRSVREPPGRAPPFVFFS